MTTYDPHGAGGDGDVRHAGESTRRTGWLVGGLAVTAVALAAGLVVVNPGGLLAGPAARPATGPVAGPSLPATSSAPTPSAPVPTSPVPATVAPTTTAPTTSAPATAAPTEATTPTKPTVTKTQATKPTVTKTQATKPTGTKKAVTSAAARRVDIGGGAKIAVPAGWTLTRSEYGWCLNPAGAKAGACEVDIRRHPSPRFDARLDSDTDGGFESNPQFCGPGATARTTAADTTWGGRAADFRTAAYDCGVTTAWYVVPTWPAYVMHTEHATPVVRDAMATVARDSVLPARSRPVRLTEFGVVTSVTPVKGGHRVVVDRAVRAHDGTIRNSNPATYAYTVPTLPRCDGSDAALRPGDRVKLYSADGRQARVSWCYRP